MNYRLSTILRITTLIMATVLPQSLLAECDEPICVSLELDRDSYELGDTVYAAMSVVSRDEDWQGRVAFMVRLPNLEEVTISSYRVNLLDGESMTFPFEAYPIPMNYRGTLAFYPQLYTQRGNFGRGDQIWVTLSRGEPEIKSGCYEREDGGVTSCFSLMVGDGRVLIEIWEKPLEFNFPRYKCNFPATTCVLQGGQASGTIEIIDRETIRWRRPSEDWAIYRWVDPDSDD